MFLSVSKNDVERNKKYDVSLSSHGLMASISGSMHQID